MAEQNEEKIIGMDATPEQQKKMVHLGKMMGYPMDDFDRQVLQHLIESGAVKPEPEDES